MILDRKEWATRHAFRAGKRLILMLNLLSYTDEGGHEDDPGRHYLAMAGFVAPAGVWEVFTEEWLTTLKLAGLERPFSMKDFAHCREEFEGWDEPRRRALLARLVEIIRNTKAMPIGAVISLVDYGSLTRGQQQCLREPFFVVFQFCTRTAAITASDEPPDERVSMFYAYNSEYGVKFGGRAEKLWNDIRAKFGYGNRMGAYTSLPMEFKNAPLHAADLLAYELAHDFESTICRPHLGMRWPLKQIVRLFRIPKPMFLFFDRFELLRVIQENPDRCPDQTGVEELPPNAVELAKEKMIKWLTIRGEYECEWPQ